MKRESSVCSEHKNIVRGAYNSLRSVNMDCRLSVLGSGLKIMGYGLWVLKYGFRSWT